MKTSIKTIINAIITDNKEFIIANGDNIASYLINEMEQTHHTTACIDYLTSEEIEEAEENPNLFRAHYDEIEAFINNNYDMSVNDYLTNN
jgi:hypothetical protein